MRNILNYKITKLRIRRSSITRGSSAHVNVTEIGDSSDGVRRARCKTISKRHGAAQDPFENNRDNPKLLAALRAAYLEDFSAAERPAARRSKATCLFERGLPRSGSGKVIRTSTTKARARLGKLYAIIQKSARFWESGADFLNSVAFSSFVSDSAQFNMLAMRSRTRS